MIKTFKIIYLGLFLFLFQYCTSGQETIPLLQPVTVVLPPCGCTEKEIRPIAARRVLDLGIEEYMTQKKVVLDKDVEEELLSIPQVFLYDFSLSELKKDQTATNQPTQKIEWEAKGKISEPKLETFLKEKKVEEVNGIHVYSNKNSGNRALELIQNFSIQRQKERKLDRDKYYKDRIDMLERAKTGRRN